MSAPSDDKKSALRIRPPWFLLGCASSALAVVTGSLASHWVPSVVAGGDEIEFWKTAQRYQVASSIGLAMCGLVKESTARELAGWLFSGGSWSRCAAVLDFDLILSIRHCLFLRRPVYNLFDLEAGFGLDRGRRRIVVDRGMDCSWLRRTKVVIGFIAFQDGLSFAHITEQGRMPSGRLARAAKRCPAHHSMISLNSFAIRKDNDDELQASCRLRSVLLDLIGLSAVDKNPR